MPRWLRRPRGEEVPIAPPSRLSVMPNWEELLGPGPIQSGDAISAAPPHMLTSVIRDMRISIRDMRPTDAYIVGTEACSLRRGCTGFCETCKTCLLHCHCEKKNTTPPETRRIRL